MSKQSRRLRDFIGDILVVLGVRLQGRGAHGYVTHGGRATQYPNFYYWAHSSDGQPPLILLRIISGESDPVDQMFSPKQALQLCENGLRAVDEVLDRAGLIEAPDWDVRTVRYRHRDDM